MGWILAIVFFLAWLVQTSRLSAIKSAAERDQAMLNKIWNKP